MKHNFPLPCLWENVKYVQIEAFICSNFPLYIYIYVCVCVCVFSQTPPLEQDATQNQFLSGVK